MIDFLNKWQEGLAGVATIVAASIAYLSVMKHIDSDKKISNDEIIRKRKSYISVLEIAINGHIRNLNHTLQDLINIRSSLGQGIDLRDRLNIAEKCLEFDVGLFDNWDMYSHLPADFVAKFMEFHEDTRHQQRMLDSLRSVVIPELPLLRAINVEDKSVESIRSRLGALIAAVEETMESAEVVRMGVATGTAALIGSRGQK